MSEHPSFASMPDGEPINGKSYRADGWQYVDLPSRLSLEMRDYFLKILGEGEYVILVASSGHDWWRGQLLISPVGQSNLKAHIEAHKAKQAETTGAPPCLT